MPLKYTRAMITTALNGQLDQVEFHSEPYMGLWIPTEVPGVPEELLNPVLTWQDKDAYQKQTCLLIERFETNFKLYTETVSGQVAAAGPHQER
jgi:phosphoenolpyruvate carboxykinase (ATP)